MTTIRLEFLKSKPFAGKRRAIGEIVEAKPRDAKVLKALGIAKDAPAPKPYVPPVVPRVPAADADDTPATKKTASKPRIAPAQD